MRVLVLAHGHPDLAAGGAERAAYALFQALKGSDGTEATFLAFGGTAAVGRAAPLGAFRGRPDELLAAPPAFDRFSLGSFDHDALARMLEAVVARLRPDLVHVHHYIHWSLEVVDVFHRLGLPVVLTLHEFVPICHNEGQMVKTSGALCEAWSPAECAACFPAVPPGHFFLRKAMIDARFAKVAHVIAPSRFLAGRYEAWGLSATRLSVIDNVLGTEPTAPDGEGRRREQNRTRFGFFGQITPFKGLDVLLRAVRLLTAAERADLLLGVHGANLEHQEAGFRDGITRACKALGDCVVVHGAYRNGDVLRLMGRYDWIVVPSLWWENSPVVIDEALRAGKPLIGSDIGGVREKASRDPRSLFFDVGSPTDLADALRHAAAHPPAPPAGDPFAAGAERDRLALEAVRAVYARALDRPPPAA